MQFQKITPYLWFEDQAEEAATFYCSIFKNSTITSASSMIVEFQLEGMSFIAINGGPQYKFNEAVSFYVLCEDQQEVDNLWSALTQNGGSEGKCGWCKDKDGLSWQIIPKRFREIMKSSEPEQAQKVIAKMLTMNKMVVADFEEVING